MPSPATNSNTPPAIALPRVVGVGTATSVVVANMIGTGIFTTSGLMLARLESGWLMLACWLAGGLLALCGALCYAELSTMMPQAGGEYVYLREVYGPAAGFLTGWTSFFVGFSAPVAAAAVACAKYLTAADVLPSGWLAEKATALGIVVVLVAVHYRGVKLGSWVQNSLTALKLLLLGGLMVIGFLVGRGDWQFMRLGSDFWIPGHGSQLGIAMLWVMFAYSGWNASGYVAGELKQPGRSLPRSLLWGTLVVTVTYFLVNLLFLFAAPVEALRGVIPVGDVAATHLFGSGAARWLSLLIGLALLSSLSAYVFIGPRVYYAMARDGLFFRFAGRIHPRYSSPALSIAAQGVAAGAMILTGTFEQLLTYIGFALGLFPWMAVLGVFLLRKREPHRERPYKVWGYPWIPATFLIGMACILAVAFINQPGPSLLALLTVAAGLPAYLVLIRRKKRNEEETPP